MLTKQPLSALPYCVIQRAAGQHLRFSRSRASCGAIMSVDYSSIATQWIHETALASCSRLCADAVEYQMQTDREREEACKARSRAFFQMQASRLRLVVAHPNHSQPVS